MDDVRCGGTEESIEDCRFNVWGNNDCSHSEDLSVICKLQYVTRINPNTGSVLGGTRVTIEGVGFSTDSFNYFPGTEHLGNKAFFVNDHYMFPCEVIVDRTTQTRIVCVTIADMPYGNDYRIQVNVDGIDIDNRCRNPSYCSYQPSLSSTPTITNIDPLSGVPVSPNKTTEENPRHFTSL
ncbi:uncharacterized protein LOC117340526 [Pecten maximus]|uniref:uncharacterized protein LOC117340526 n=1 Tax=Pecten maximus TaxID=6579 RepID=UPI001458CE96|nr:uncharacterized protein LOC117340526 [Pecten maximus]